MTFDELKSFLDEKSDLYNNPDFIESDPIQIPHSFSVKEDVEISAFLAATIAWGNRKSVIGNAKKMMVLMGDSPFDFVMSHSENDLEKFEGFVHRTFNSEDLKTFVRALRHMYRNHGGMEAVFTKNANDLQTGISEFKKIFFEIPHQYRTQKHISDPLRGSAAKRIHMMLRWLARQDNKGVDLGIWKGISPSLLSCPLDVHSGNIARKLGILTRKQNDSKALAELDAKLRELDPKDPVKYDFALFGLGAFEKF
ncbi:TIGR02757 family protein [Flavobacterium sp. MAH-1]|uniref:TIGR02757 family protein n=1 Tax=Flavobacterium agri TaxID=2743471 RepID=A0A7Y8XYM5_9FLAO|nr:TIGR02757 family protein [Flavobacterium agri]NUY79333.1 TIGR02757 family protein [Flavobacterium agri]NYA69357.1 TIGR02757 family protein [Flavobacterium agri]